MLDLTLLHSALELVPSFVPVPWSSDDDESGILALLASGPLAGAGVYWAIWKYYRNADKSHSYERETDIFAQPVTGWDRYLGERTGLSKSSINGRNESRHRKRVQRMDPPEHLVIQESDGPHHNGPPQSAAQGQA